MLKKRLIAVLLYKDENLVQSINFTHPVAIGNAITKIKFYNSWSVDEIILINISRDKSSKKSFFNVVDELSSKSFLPLTVGGWIENVNDIKKFLTLGADKVIINTEAFQNPNFFKKSAEIFGSQCIVLSIDVKKKDNMYEVILDRGRKSTGIDVLEWSKKAEKLGAGEIFLNSIDHDGARKGYDLNLLKKIKKNITIPLIAFGGAWEWSHFVDAFKECDVDAVAAGNIFHFREHSTKLAKDYLIKSGLNVRKIKFFKI
jgi:imidazole glycerol-phosphate synthase subunit HisF